MPLTSLRLQNFRSYKDGSFEFEPGVNIVVGPNGSGKTNLIEGLLMVAKGSSYRSRDGQLIRFGAGWARLDSVDSEDETRTLKLESSDEGDTKKTFEVGGVALKRLMPQKQLPVIIFEPNHLLLLHAEPAFRREFVDELASIMNLHAGKAQRDFKRVLAQRNALLKSKASKEQFFVWDLQFSQLAEKVVASRQAAIDLLNKKLTKTYRELGGKVKKLEVLHQSSIEYSQNYTDKLLHKLHEKHHLEIERGFTLSGPHRDDIVFLFDGVDARQRASRGEVRTIILALKIIEMELVASEKPPILLLDDVFSELDGSRRRALAERLSDYQAFITTTDADVVVEHFQESAHIIPMG